MASSNATLCGHPLKTRPGATCANRAKHFLVGGHSCGTHFKCIEGLPTSLRKPPAPPPPPSEEEQFTPFDCGICMEECTHATGSCKTICNHRFHTNCLLKWEKVGRSSFNCPMCRKELPRSIPKPPVQYVASLMSSLGRNIDQPGVAEALQRLSAIVDARGRETAETMVEEMLRNLNMMNIVE